MCILWIVLTLVVIVFIFKEVKEGFGFDNSTKYVSPSHPLLQMNTDSLATKPLATYPRDSLDIFVDATFKPECCLLSPYSNSDGCLCPARGDAGLIVARGGNR
jgi:hypothetical protein